MSSIRDGIPASPGIVIGNAHVLRAEVPEAAAGAGIDPEAVDAEVERFIAACEASKTRLRELQEQTREQVGAVEAQIFEPQIMMLEDPALIQATIASIRNNFLTAERAFEWRVLEWEAQWSHTAHPMVLDKLNDLLDIHSRVMRHLMGMPEPGLEGYHGEDRVILVAKDLTPSMTVQLNPEHVLGIAMEGGTRTSHSAILARSLHIPCVASLSNITQQVETGQELILDGRAGKLIIGPAETEKTAYRERDFQIREWEQELLLVAHLDSVTRDGVRVALRANIDLPGEAGGARAHGAEGIGLFRTEFLVVGRNSFPAEDEQYAAYRSVAETFPNAPVVIRTYDLGGDKFPAFLRMPPEENPFLGWRSIRVCLDEPEMFRAQLRALLRASVAGDIRIMLPLVNEIREIEETRRHLDESLLALHDGGIEAPGGYTLGAMIETPAAALSSPALARHVDFLSIGTNDLVQYTLAVDRGNSRLAGLYNPFHPSVVRLLFQVAEAGAGAGLEVSVCGELAAHPLGAFMLIGMGIDSLSVGPAALGEIKQVIRSVNRCDAREAVAAALSASTPAEVVAILTAGLGDVIDLSLFMSN